VEAGKVVYEGDPVFEAGECRVGDIMNECQSISAPAGLRPGVLMI